MAHLSAIQAFVLGFCSSGYDFAIASSRPHLTMRTLQVAIGFAGNCAPCGLSPQTNGMPVIPRKKAALTSRSSVFIILEHRNAGFFVHRIEMRKKNRLWLGGDASRRGAYMIVCEHRRTLKPTTPQAVLTSIYSSSIAFILGSLCSSQPVAACSSSQV